MNYILPLFERIKPERRSSLPFFGQSSNSMSQPSAVHEVEEQRSEVQEQESSPTTGLKQTGNNMLAKGKAANCAAPARRLLRPRDRHTTNNASSAAVSVGNGPVAHVAKPKQKRVTANISPNTDEGEYEVEEILERKPAGPAKWQYLVKWANYPGEDTWEREENLKACPALMSKFKESLKTRSRASSRAPGKTGGGIKKRAQPAMKPPQSSSPAAAEDEEAEDDEAEDDEAEDDEAEEYVVEKLLKWRGEGESLEYLVKWKDYGDDEATWESAKKFVEMKGLIKDMERREAKRAAAAKANITKPKSAAPPTKKRRKRVVARL